MSKQIRITRNGVPTYVAPWFKNLTSEGKKLIGQNNIMAPYGRHHADYLTKVEYSYQTTEQFLASLEAPSFLSIAAE
jgi:hypothetical protein